MGSSGKKRTTMAKLNRESRLREKRAEKAARKNARKLMAASDAADGAARPHELGTALEEIGAGESDAALSDRKELAERR
jgi:hypothetical protein